MTKVCEDYNDWAETHKLQKAVFWWTNKECTLRDRTFNECLEIVKSYGFKEPKWYKPWTWGNGVVTVG